MRREFVGEGVYLEMQDDFTIKLETTNKNVLQEIYLEPAVMARILLTLRDKSPVFYQGLIGIAKSRRTSK